MNKKYKPLLRQINIVHVSDLHFGPNHRFQAEITPMADRPNDKGYPTLADSLTEDFKKLNLDGPVILCATGDFAEYGKAEEFDKAEKFFKDIFEAKIKEFPISKNNTFIVAGNHDVIYDAKTVDLRMQQWTEFYNRLFDDSIRRENQLEMCRIHDLVEEYGVVVLTLNSSLYVQKDTPDLSRGNVDFDQLTLIEEELEKFESEKLKNSIKICLVHHHPVLIPQLVESGRGYDAVLNSGTVLQILKRFGFHLVLHGHKHNPFVFTDDVEGVSTNGLSHPIFFSCAGSVGSTELPDGISNCYNIITVKYHPDGDQFRVRCETRTLNTRDERGYNRLPKNWYWTASKEYDRFFQRPEKVPVHSDKIISRKFDKEKDANVENLRTQVYKDTRGYLPFVQVKPSLMNGQAYEAICEIVKHQSPRAPDDSMVKLKKVVWTAGEYFDVNEVMYADDPACRVSIQYYGSMLIQATMHFEDGHTVTQHIYAPLPKVESGDGG
ncbi:metallophosphoesterase family protein [Thalassospira tepidiphila]|uniref:metallophosphoesterase family protein n=1 Tax=Thalassospira tepidiphila TaxID=393657 RepID=UPI0029251A2B|nr:hypothetical protein MACH01_10930 [Thalassospira tepidiphila]